MSVDFSDAVEANRLNFPQSENHRIAQADILALPFAPASFPLVVSLGVIQHTPSPERTISALSTYARPAGWLAIDHYSPTLSHYTKITALVLRPLIKRLPPAAGLRVTELLTNAILPAHRAARRIYPIQTILSRVSPVMSYYHAYPGLTEELQREWALLDTHDMLSDWYKHRRTPRHIRRLLRELGLEAVWCESGGNGVEARGRRPDPKSLMPDGSSEANGK